MGYYCFLCNEYHSGEYTQEHFIPRAINGPGHQWLPACEKNNIRSNKIIDACIRNLLFWVRFKNTDILKRFGIALLSDGSLRKYKFSYHENADLEKGAEFKYFFDKDTGASIPQDSIYAIAFPVGFTGEEKELFCKAISKISLGALTYLLINKNIAKAKIKRILSQPYLDAIRCIALDLIRRGNSIAVKFSLGRTDIINHLHESCNNQNVRNHVININLRNNKIIIEGMLYSNYGWALDIPNKYNLPSISELRLENEIINTDAPLELIDKCLSQDTIVLVNPSYCGTPPEIPEHWKN